MTDGLCLKSFAGMTTGNRNNIEVAEITTENGNNIEDCRDASTPYVVIPAKAGIQEGGTGMRNEFCLFSACAKLTEMQ